MERSEKYKIAISETLHYLKGIRREDFEKIPKKLIKFLKDNSLKEYECNFDYTKKLNELNLHEETKGLIGMICLNYWCETEEQKNIFLNKLNENEKKYQDELREKYNLDNLFKKKEENAIIQVNKEGFFRRMLNAIKSFFIKY